MSFSVRDAVLADAPALTRLSREELGYDYPEEELRANLEDVLSDSRNRVLVAESDGEVLGYLHLADYRLLYMPPLKRILGIAVFSAHHREGIGKALLEAGEAWAREEGAAGVVLTSGETRTGAHAFYRALGYEGIKMQLNLKKEFSGRG